MRMFFTKMHGCGNDYIFFDCRDHDFKDPSKYAQTLSNRHYSIGGDGIVLICRSDVADAKMRIFNIDGSEATMCGNAIRCVGKYLYEEDIHNRSCLTIETLSGVKKLTILKNINQETNVRVDMGKAVLYAPEGKDIATFSIPILNKTFQVTCVSVGNPHCVIFMDNIESLALDKIGPLLEHNSLFPGGINVEFVQVINSHELSTRVWERGSGPTLACGTGACAAVSAAVHHGFCCKNQDICVHLPGGDLLVQYTPESVYLTGPAAVSFEGETEL